MVFWLFALAVFAVDRLTKLAVTAKLELGQSVPVIPGVFHITLVLNPGGAFGFLPNARFYFTLIAVLVFAGVLVYYLFYSSDNRALHLALGLVLGGVAGNLFDRLTVGKVIDWIDFRVWPVFNVADAALVVGLALIALGILTARETARED